jgi:hypothetical protein
VSGRRPQAITQAATALAEPGYPDAMRRVGLLVTVSLLLWAQPVLAAVSHPKKTVLARGIAGAAAVDGDHLVAWGGGRGRLAVYDDQTRTKTLMDIGRSCSRIVPIDASKGFFLISCGINGPEGPETLPIVFDSLTGVTIDLPPGVYDRIGTQWAEGAIDQGGREVVVYVNWHTGETYSEGEAPSGDVRTPFNLDSANLEAVALAAENFAVGSGMALEQVRDRGRYSVHLMGRMDDKRLARCAHACEALSMKGGLALWNDGPTKLFGYFLKSPHRRREWRVSEDAVVRGATKQRVYYLTPSTSSPQFSDLRSFSWR